MVAQDDSPGPTGWFHVSNGTMKDRTVRDFAMILRARHQRQPGLERELVRCAQPGLVISERRALSGADRIIMQCSDTPRLVTGKNLDGSFHKGVGSFLMRTRLGSRSSSNSSPSSS